MRSVSPEHSLLSHIHKTSVYVYIIFYQSLLRQALECVQSRQSVDYSRPCTKWANIWHFLDKPYHACILFRAFTALTHAQKWVCIWHVLSVMLRQDLVCVQSRQSSHCSSPSSHCSSPLHKMGVHMAYSFSECSAASEHGRSITKAFAARTLTKCMHVYRSNLNQRNMYQNVVRWLKYSTCLRVC